MPKLEILGPVTEDKLVETLALFSASGADIITAINDNEDPTDNKNTFTIEATFFGSTPATGSPITFKGKMSTFGGPDDPGVGPNEGLSLFGADDVAANPDLFLPTQPPGTTGLAKRLNPDAKYLACRWNLSVTPKSFLKLKTTMVKVTNPKNGRSENARPADTGPALFTNRVADLSLGLATALGLETNDICQVEIPTPADAQFPAGTGVAVTVNAAKIDATIFPKDMTRTLVVMTTSDRTSHWVINLIGHQGGGQTLMRKVGSNAAEPLRSDTVILPIKADAQISDSVAAELNKAIQKEPEAPLGPAGPAPGPGDDINAKVLASAIAFVGQDTSHVPLTHNGRLACAWAVNEVVRLALSKPISTEENGDNGLSTIGLFAALKAHHTRLNSAADAKPGTIIIAPTEGDNHGHVGIVGATKGRDATPVVFSNSSDLHEFAQNFTISSFTRQYTRHGLQVLFFALKGDQFHS